MASGDRSAAAQALLRMAEVYTKLGQPAARETYQTIVRDYPDQPVATVARTRLSAGVASRRQEVTPRRVLEGGWAQMFAISADGRFTVGPERAAFSAFNIMLRDVVTGRATTLIEGTGKGSGFQARISNDGRRVAYNWWDEKGVFSLRVIGTEAGATPQTIIGDPLGFTTSGTFYYANRNWKVMRVPSVGGLVEFDGLSFETLAPLIPELRMWPGNFNNIDVSPDGTRIIASSLTFTKNELWTLDNLLSVVSSR